MMTHRPVGDNHNETDFRSAVAAPSGDTMMLAGGPIEEGKIDGAPLSFKAGPTTYTGVVKGDELELTRSAPPRCGGGPPPATTTEARPAIGPPPNGTDPSSGAGFGGRGGRPPAPLVLRQVKR